MFSDENVKICEQSSRSQGRVLRQQWQTTDGRVGKWSLACRHAAVYRPLSAGAFAAFRLRPGTHTNPKGRAAWYDFQESSTHVLSCNYNTWAWQYEVQRLPTNDRRSSMSDERLYSMPTTSLNSKYISAWYRPPYKSVRTSLLILSTIMLRSL